MRLDPKALRRFRTMTIPIPNEIFIATDSNYIVEDTIYQIVNELERTSMEVWKVKDRINLSLNDFIHYDIVQYEEGFNVTR